MSKRVRLFVSYDGTGYHGWQIQNNALTVEQVITEALQKLTGEEIEIYGVCDQRVFTKRISVQRENGWYFQRHFKQTRRLRFT